MKYSWKGRKTQIKKKKKTTTKEASFFQLEWCPFEKEGKNF